MEDIIGERIIDIDEIDNLIGNINLIDIREPYEYEGGTLQTAKNIPMNELAENPDKYLEKDKEYYILCRSGVRSARTCYYLRKLGYNVIDVGRGRIEDNGDKRV